MFSDSLVILDFETTGLSPDQGDRITEVAALRITANGIIDRYESLVNCGVRIPPFITAYTGITQHMVNGAPPVKKVVRELLDFIGQTPIVAHNASFDQRFLDSECYLSGAKSVYGSLICSMRISRRIFPNFRSHALGSLAAQLTIPFGASAHRAGADADVTARLMIRIAQEIRQRNTRLTIDESLLRRIMKMPIATAHSQLQRITC